MRVRPLHLLILKTGESIPAVRERHGGFVDMFRASLATHEPAPAVELEVLDVTAQGERDALPELSRFDGALMTGSPAMVGEDAPWMRYGQRVINHIVDAELPFLGVCFGHQLLGVARGADVGPNPRGREVGSVEVAMHDVDGDRLLDGITARFVAQVSHVDVIRDPRGKLEVLARAPHDAAHVVRAGPWAWGVQFHPEFDEAIVLEYIRARRQLIDAEHGHGGAEQRLEGVRPAPVARALLVRFLAVCEERRRTSGAREERLRAG